MVVMVVQLQQPIQVSPAHDTEVACVWNRQRTQAVSCFVCARGMQVRMRASNVPHLSRCGCSHGCSAGSSACRAFTSAAAQMSSVHSGCW